MLLADLLKPRFFHSPADAVADPPSNGKVESEKETIESDVGDEIDDEDDEGDDIAPETDTVDEPEPAVAEQSLTALGFPSDDPTELRRHWDSMQQQAQRAAQYEAQLQHLQMQMLMAQQARQAPQPQPVEKPKLPWQVPEEYKPEMMQFLYRDENGNLVVKPGGDPRLVQWHTQYAQTQQQALHQLITDPFGFVKQFAAPLIEQERQQLMQAQQQQWQQLQRQQQIEAELNAYTAENQKYLYGPTGQLNELGQMFNAHYQQGVQYGLPNPVKYAKDMIDAEVGRFRMAQEQAAPPPQTAADINAANKLKILKKGAKRTAQRGGSQGSNGRSVATQNGENPFDRVRDKWKDLPDDVFKKSI